MADAVLNAYAFLLGAVVGSFLNVVIHRLPRGESLVRPGSRCPACGRAIRWFDNLPILSWVVLGARCRACRAPISMRYPLIEAAAGFAALLAYQRWGLSVAGVEAVLFVWVSLALAFIDLEHQILPDVLTLPTIVLGLASSFVGGLARPLDSALGAAVGAGIPVLVIVVYAALRGEEGMGWGDVKYLAAIGAVLGVRDCLSILVAAAVLGALVGLGLVVSGRGSGKTALPFGTFLALAAVVWIYLPPSWDPFFFG